MLDDDRIGNRSVVVSSVNPGSFLPLSRIPQTSHHTEDEREKKFSTFQQQNNEATTAGQLRVLFLEISAENVEGKMCEMA